MNAAELKEVKPTPPEPTGAAHATRETIRSSLRRQLGEHYVVAERAPPRIPDHDLLQHIGTGAYGDVWLAKSTLGTLRAVKIVYRDRFDEDRPYEREFEGILRYEPVSRSHAGLTGVLHVGRNDAAGHFYYIMELADDANSAGDSQAAKSDGNVTGQDAPRQYKPMTLRSLLSRRKQVPPREVAQLGLELAGALAHLHQHGLVHRDIKPSNVIFISGKPKLADIGLITGSGDSHSFVGTEGFIPPEGPGRVQGDIYSLGKLLYEATTGRDRLEFPKLPLGILSLPEREGVLELNEIVTRTCAPDPNNRYATATELIGDLNLFLSGRSLRETHAVAHRLKWLKRSGVVGTLLLGLALAAAIWARHSAVNARRAEQRSHELARKESLLRERAQTAIHESRQQLFSALLEQARAKVRSGESGQRLSALHAIRRAGAISNSVDLRREAMAALALPDLRLKNAFPVEPTQTIAQLDHTFLRLAFALRSGPVEVRSMPDQRTLYVLPPVTNFWARTARWSPNNRFLAIKRDSPGPDGDSCVEIWDLQGPRRVVAVQHVSDNPVSFHPRFPRVLIAVRGGLPGIWDLETGLQVDQFNFEETVEVVAYSPDGEAFAASRKLAGRWEVGIFRCADGAPLSAASTTDYIASLEWHPDGRRLALSDHGSAVRIMDARSGGLRLLGRHRLQAVSTTFTPDGRYLLSGGWERELICWDMSTMERAFVIDEESFMAQFADDGRSCAIQSPTVLQLGTLERPVCCRELPEDLGWRLDRAEFSPDGTWLAASAQGGLGIWDMKRGGPCAFLPEGFDCRLAFSQDSQRLFATRDNDSLAWSISPGSEPSAPPVLAPIEMPKLVGFRSVCSVSNQVVLTCSLGSCLLPVDDLSLPEPKWLPTISGLNNASPDGRYLGIFKPFSAMLYIYALPGFENVTVLTNLTNIRHFGFSSTGNEVSVSSTSGVISWSTTNWQRIREITNCIGAIFSPPGDRVWLMKSFHSAALCDNSTLEPLLPLPSGMLALAVDPAGDNVAVSLQYRKLQVWNLPALFNQFQELGISLEKK